jgi:hypothetical protein
LKFLGPVTGYALRNHTRNETTEEQFGVANVEEERTTEVYRTHWRVNMGRMFDNRLPRGAIQYTYI